MRIDSPQIVGSLTVDPGSESILTGSFTGSFAGDGSGLTGVAPIAGAGVIVEGTTVSIGQDVATTSSVTFNVVNATTVDTTDLVVAGISASAVDITGDLNVAGTASFGLLTSTTASSFIIGDARVLLNADTPAVRFAGVTVVDSGSDPYTTASFLYDGDSHDWKYEYESGGDHDAAVALFGPVMSDLTGSIYPVSESVVVGTGGHHLTSSIIHISDDEVRIHGAVSASGVGLFSGLGVGTAASGTIGAILATNDVVAFASSDERLKENVTLIGGALDKVESLRGVEFDWIANEEIHPNNGHDLGVIAQEVEAVLPVLVQTRENGYKAVKYDKLTAVLIEAVKELSARVKELESK
jgi:hypothetical protein